MNTETRKLIKRSSRARDLKERFRIDEMSSISTLKLRGSINRCGRVGGTKHLSACKLLKRISSSCSSGHGRRNSVSGIIGTIHVAAGQGNMEMIKYCVANKCPINEWVCANAALNGQLECLKYLREEGKAPWDWGTAAWAARNGHLHILEYLVERKFDEYNEFMCDYAAKYGHLDCLKYLRNRQSAVGL